MRPALAPRVIALDDWLIFAEDAAGEIFFTSSEIWPEWLDQAAAPEDMTEAQFRAATLKILETKHVTDWSGYREWFIAGEIAFLERRGTAVDSLHRAAAESDADEAIAEIRKLAREQAIEPRMRPLVVDTVNWRCMTGVRAWWDHFADCSRLAGEDVIGCIDAPDGYPAGAHWTVPRDEREILVGSTYRRDW